MQHLEEANTKYVELLISSNADEKDIESDMDSHENYKLQFLTARLTLTELNDGNNEVLAQPSTVPRSERRFKRPTLEIPKFSGSVGKWLQFWSPFRKIHEEKTISKEDNLTLAISSANSVPTSFGTWNSVPSYDRRRNMSLVPSRWLSLVESPVCRVS